MSTPPYMRSVPEGVVLSIKAQPRASRNEIGGVVGTELKVRVTAPPVDSAANEAIVAFLAEQLGLPPRCVTLIKGRSSRQKQVLVQGLSAAHIAKALGG